MSVIELPIWVLCKMSCTSNADFSLSTAFTLPFLCSQNAMSCFPDEFILMMISIYLYYQFNRHKKIVGPIVLKIFCMYVYEQQTETSFWLLTSLSYSQWKIIDVTVNILAKLYGSGTYTDISIPIKNR